MQEYVDVCDAVNPTHCVSFELCALHMQHSPVHHVLKTAPQFINHSKKTRRTASTAVCLHYTNTQRFWLLFCALDHFSLCIIIQFCVGFQKKKKLESALEKLMWGDECAASKYVNRPSYLCACMRVMKENERRENQINL